MPHHLRQILLVLIFLLVAQGVVAAWVGSLSRNWTPLLTLNRKTRGRVTMDRSPSRGSQKALLLRRNRNPGLLSLLHHPRPRSTPAARRLARCHSCPTAFALPNTPTERATPATPNAEGGCLTVPN